MLHTLLHNSKSIGKTMPGSATDKNLPVAVAGTVGAVVGGGVAAVAAAPVVIIGGAAVAVGAFFGGIAYAMLK